MKKENTNKALIVTIFAIAMAFLETAVVIYLRKIYYPAGFDFPLKGFIEPNILAIEWVREFATIVMLLAIGYLAGKKLSEKFAYFILAFGIWDIFYYIFLKMALNWPSSFLTWDLLFLIPLPWIGPVLTPVIISIIMICASIFIIKSGESGKTVKLKLVDWFLLTFSIALILYTWLVDYARLIFSGGFAGQFFSLAYSSDFYSAISAFSPNSYNWYAFWVAIVMILMVLVRFIMEFFRKK